MAVDTKTSSSNAFSKLSQLTDMSQSIDKRRVLADGRFLHTFT